MTANYRNLTRTFHQRYMYITTKIMYLTAILQQPSNNITSMSHVECMLYTRKLQYCVLRVTLLSDSCKQHTFNLCSFLSGQPLETEYEFVLIELRSQLQ